MTRTVAGSGRALLSLIDQILDFSKIEAGKMAIDVVDFDLHGELADLVSILQAPGRAQGPAPGRACRRGRTLCAARRPPASAPDPDQPDRQRGQVHREGPCRAARRAGPSKRQGWPSAACCASSVTDTGVGIAPEPQKSMFDSFTQADGATNRRFGGTGLGLAIVRELAQVMGGEVGLESKLGQGSAASGSCCPSISAPAAPAAESGGAVQHYPDVTRCGPRPQHPPGALGQPAPNCWKRRALPSCAGRCPRGAKPAGAITRCCWMRAPCRSRRYASPRICAHFRPMRNSCRSCCVNLSAARTRRRSLNAPS